MTDYQATSLSSLLLATGNCSSFREAEIPGELVQDCIRKAAEVPLHGLSHPGCFYLLGAETARALAEFNARCVAERKDEAAAQKKLTQWLSVPYWILVTANIHRSPILTTQHHLSCACLTHSVRLLLAEKGIASAWTLPAIVRREDFYELCGLKPGEEEVVCLLRYGYPVEELKELAAKRLPANEQLIQQRP